MSNENFESERTSKVVLVLVLLFLFVLGCVLMEGGEQLQNCFVSFLGAGVCLFSLVVAPLFIRFDD